MPSWFVNKVPIHKTAPDNEAYYSVYISITRYTGAIMFVEERNVYWSPWVLVFLRTSVSSLLMPIWNWYLTCFQTVGACIVFNPFHKRETQSKLPISRPFRLSYFIFSYFLSSIITTAISTSLIVFRILSTTQRNPSVTNHAPYRRIQRIIIESGIIYILGLLVTGAPLAMMGYITSGSAPRRLVMPGYFFCSVMLTYSQALLIPFSVSFSSRITTIPELTSL